MGTSRFSRPEVGDKFGSWVVVGHEQYRREVAARVRCGCGTERVVPFYNLRRGASTACRQCSNADTHEILRDRSGCADVIPDKAHRERWLNRRVSAIARCHNPANANFHRYGGRGIHVCDEWREDPAAFLRWIVTQPGWDRPELELDRRDNKGPYSPGNCRLASRAEQCSNTCRTVFVEWGGERLSAHEFWRRHCPGYRSGSTVTRKLRAGVAPADIIAAQAGCRGPYLRHSELRAA